MKGTSTNKSRNNIRYISLPILGDLGQGVNITGNTLWLYELGSIILDISLEALKLIPSYEYTTWGKPDISFSRNGDYFKSL